MKQIDPAVITQYERTLAKDPKSKIFAALADAYREVGQIAKAEDVAQKGIALHPNYVGGYVALGRVFCQAKKFEAAIPVLQKAAQIAPENILAYQLLGLCFVELKQPKEALKAHKMALFLNPMSERSRQAVQKLEILTAEEYEQPLFDLPEAGQFQFQKLQTPAPETPPPAEKKNPVLERELSYVDALILRNELPAAHKHLKRLLFQGFKAAEIDERLELVSLEDETSMDENTQRLLEIDWRINVLKKLLDRVEQARDQRLTLTQSQFPD